jgi:hypothetical protein
LSGVSFKQIGNRLYGAFVLGAAFVEGGVAGGGVDPESLQPVNTALKARPNSNTTKDSFFIGTRTLYWFGAKHK